MQFKKTLTIILALLPLAAGQAGAEPAADFGSDGALTSPALGAWGEDRPDSEDDLIAEMKALRFEKSDLLAEDVNLDELWIPEGFTFPLGPIPKPLSAASRHVGDILALDDPAVRFTGATSWLTMPWGGSFLARAEAPDAGSILARPLPDRPHWPWSLAALEIEPAAFTMPVRRPAPERPADSPPAPASAKQAVGSLQFIPQAAGLATMVLLSSALIRHKRKAA